MIKGLTNTVPAFARIGKLRKGGKKKDGKYGDDLSYFRFTSDYPDIEKRFYDFYGETPRSIRVYLPYETTDQNFPTAMKQYTRGGLVHSCDGEYVIYQRVGNKIVNVEGQGFLCPYNSGEKKRTKSDPGCVNDGKLNVIIPDLQIFGVVEVGTHSKLDIIFLDGFLRALESVRNDFGKTLQGVPLMLSRVEREISTPSKNGRAMRKKWLIDLRPQAEWSGLLLSAVVQKEIAWSQIVSTTAHALPSGIDIETGEIIMPDMNDEPPFVTDIPTRKVPDIIYNLHEVADENANAATDKARKAMFAALSKMVKSNDDKKKLLKKVFGIESSKDMTAGQCSAIIQWSGSTKENDYTANQQAVAEAEAVLAEVV